MASPEQIIGTRNISPERIMTGIESSIPAGRDIKRLIICCDGTWQSSDSGPQEIPTNISRLARAINCVKVNKKTKHEIQQIVYYQSGVGSGDLNVLQRGIAGGVGLGLDQHVREAYAFLANNYQLHDEIFLFGFSRGAYTARAVAGVISNFGILTKAGMEDFNEIYEQYKNGPEAFATWRAQWKKPWRNYKAYSIQVVGCFDTVGSVGLPENWLVQTLGWNNKYKFHDTSLSTGILNAFHALALDEHRKPFTPTMWYLPETKDIEANLQHSNPPINLLQCWFPGVHTNVGGGYDDTEISDITLMWMIDRCKGFLSFDEEYLKEVVEKSGKIPFDVEPDPDATPEQRAEAKSRTPATTWAHGTVYDSSKGLLSLLGSTYRTPGRYGKPGSTNEWMHPSVRVRYDEDEKWKISCLSLSGLEKKIEKTAGRWQWEQKMGGDLPPVPEWVMVQKGWEEKLAGEVGMAKVNERN